MTLELSDRTQNGVNRQRVYAFFLRRKSVSTSFLPLFLRLAAAAGLIFSQALLHARSMDGFFAYCTSNHDRTGECVNEEDGLKLSCLIVPGQIISCPVLSKSVECIWISSISANQAQFWCDPTDEAVIYGAIFSESRPNQLQDSPKVITEPDMDQGPALFDVFKNGF